MSRRLDESLETNHPGKLQESEAEGASGHPNTLSAKARVVRCCRSSSSKPRADLFCDASEATLRRMQLFCGGGGAPR